MQCARSVTARPHLLQLVTLVLMAATLHGCTGDAPDAPVGGSLVVERTTEGDVTTVRNLSGSTWGGRAHLAEELSIGVLEGDEPYMLGSIGGLWVTDEHVYVADSQAAAVRAYDHEGVHVRDIGQQGQGPGEYGRPGDLVVLQGGTIVVHDFGNSRLVFFDTQGAPLRTWRTEEGFLTGIAALDDDRLLVRRALPRDEEESGPRIIRANGAVTSVGADGELGETRLVPDLGYEEEPLMVRVGDGIMAMSGSFLFRPSHHSTVRPDGALVAGVSDRYRFEVHGEDGAVTAVEKSWEPVPVTEEELDYTIAMVEGRFRRMDPSWTYDGPPPPTTKPAYQSLTADRDGRVWALRHLESERLEDCVEDPREDIEGADRRPCFRPRQVIDAFAPDGSYLGQLSRPDGLTFRAVFIRGDAYWAAVEDEYGLVTVRRFRLVTPSTT